MRLKTSFRTEVPATHFRDLSGDPEELIFGVDRLLEAIKQKNVDEPQREYRDYLIEFVELFNRHELEVYVLSFTEKQDSRHHWKRYDAAWCCNGVVR